MARPDKENIQDVRNIGIMAHIDAGKTTTTERILYYTGRVHRMGEVHEGAATMDWMEQEQERGITITSAATTVYWKDSKINIIDTPGHADFSGEVERTLNMADGCLLIVDAQEGPMPQTRFVLKKSIELGLHPIVIMNKLDKPAANPARVHQETAVFKQLGPGFRSLCLSTVQGRPQQSFRNAPQHESTGNAIGKMHPDSQSRHGNDLY